MSRSDDAARDWRVAGLAALFATVPALYLGTLRRWRCVGGECAPVPESALYLEHPGIVVGYAVALCAIGYVAASFVVRTAYPKLSRSISSDAG